MKIIVGLGNCGSRYDDTPHNVGFAVVSAFATNVNATWNLEKQMQAIVAVTDSGIVLAMPTTYMNLSGIAVKKLAEKYKATPSEILILADDVDLPLGKIRLRKQGSHGGHRGLLSIITSLKTQEFSRLKLGVGLEEKPKSLAEYVTGKFTKEQREKAEYMYSEGVVCIERILKDGVDAAMNEINKANNGNKS